MGNFKPCMYCKNSNGFTCQQCFRKKLYECDQERVDEYAEFEKEVRADERTKVLDGILIQLTKAFNDNDDINVMYLKSYLQMTKEQNNGNNEM